MKQLYPVFPELIVVLLAAEHGEFLALDLGGTNFRVLWVKVTDNGLQKVEMENQIYAIPEDVMRGSGTQVWPISWGGHWGSGPHRSRYCSFSVVWREEILTEAQIPCPLFAGWSPSMLGCLVGDLHQERCTRPEGRECVHKAPGSGCALVGGILIFHLIWGVLACTGYWGKPAARRLGQYTWTPMVSVKNTRLWFDTATRHGGHSVALWLTVVSIALHEMEPASLPFWLFAFSACWENTKIQLLGVCSTWHCSGLRVLPHWPQIMLSHPHISVTSRITFCTRHIQ